MKLNKILELVAIQLLILMASTTFYSAISILINQKISGLFLIFGIITAMIYSFLVLSKSDFTFKTKYLNVIYINFFFLLIVIIGLLISGKYYDISHDGQMYHQEAIIQLKQGWNPIYDGHLEENPTNEKINELHISEIEPNFWINHYTKGSWYFSAVVYDLIGKIEQSKVGNIYLLVISFLLSFSLFLRLKINKLLSFWFVLLCAFNPITITQLFTFYIDGQLASLFLILIVLIIVNYLDISFKYQLAVGATIVLLINIKFTALAYALILCTIPLITSLCRLYFQKEKISLRKIVTITLNKKYLYSMVVSFILGIFVVGASSYVTNTIDHKHPFYPLAGNEKVDIMSHTTPIDFKNKSIFEKVYLSIFSETSNETVTPLKSKFPLSIKENEKEILWVMDIRVGGFGPLFGAIFILMFAGMIIWRNKFKEVRNRIFIIIITIIIFSVLINPEAWWARYVPQLWIAPIAFIVLLAKDKLNKYKMIYILSMCLLISINLILFQKSTLIKNNQLTTDLSIQLESLKEYSEFDPVLVVFDTMKSNRIRLLENNIDYKEVNNESCVNSQNLIFSNTKICISNLEKYTEIYEGNYNKLYHQ